MLDEWGIARFRQELEDRLKRSLKPAGDELRNAESSERIGIYRQKQPSMNYVGLKIPVGRIMGKKLEQLAKLAERYGNGEIRISPAQTLILPNVSDKNPGDLLEEPLSETALLKFKK